VLVALLLTLSISLNVITAAAVYRLWLWARVTAAIGTPAILGSSRGLEAAVRIVLGRKK